MNINFKRKFINFVQSNFLISLKKQILAVNRENLILKREKLTKILKIKLIYASKLKYNVIRQKIRRKTRNLTQIMLEMIQLMDESRIFIPRFEKHKFEGQVTNSFILLTKS